MRSLVNSLTRAIPERIRDKFFMIKRYTNLRLLCLPYCSISAISTKLNKITHCSGHISQAVLTPYKEGLRKWRWHLQKKNLRSYFKLFLTIPWIK